MMHRMREIAMQAANGTLSDGDRSTLNTEYEALAQEMGRVLGETEFNGHSLFGATAETIEIQVGLDDGPGSTMEIELSSLDWVAGTLDLFDMDNPFEVRFALSTIETFLGVISDQRTELGVKANLMQSALSSTLNARENLAAAESRIRDLDMAQATASFTRNQILQQGAIGVLAQAQASPELALILLGAI